MRKFWENPDSNEPDLSAAFRKRTAQEKIKTRPRIEIHEKKLKKGEKVRDQTIKFVLQEILPEMWSRETHKQTIERISDTKFDMQYEQMCTENGTAPSNQIIPTLTKYTVKQLRPKPKPELRIELPQMPVSQVIEDMSGPMSPRNPHHQQAGKRGTTVGQLQSSRRAGGNQRDEEVYSKHSKSRSGRAGANNLSNMPSLADSAASPHELKNARGKDYHNNQQAASAQEQMPNGEASDDENNKVALATARNQKARK
jgi:hypothetical protein